MRNREREYGLRQTRIEKVEIDRKSRDDIPAILIGLQEIYRNEATRDRLFELLDTMATLDVPHNTSRPGLDRWSILVLGALKTGLDCDWDFLLLLANELPILRAIMGFDEFDRETKFERQTVIDNVELLTPELLHAASDLVATSGHKVTRKLAWRMIARAR